MGAQDGSGCQGSSQWLRSLPAIRLQQAIQGALAPGYGLGIGGKFTFLSTKRRRMNLVAAIEAYGGDDMVQQLVIDDKFNEIAWYIGLIEGRVDAN